MLDFIQQNNDYSNYLVSIGIELGRFLHVTSWSRNWPHCMSIVVNLVATISKARCINALTLRGLGRGFPDIERRNLSTPVKRSKIYMKSRQLNSFWRVYHRYNWGVEIERRARKLHPIQDGLHYCKFHQPCGSGCWNPDNGCYLHATDSPGRNRFHEEKLQWVHFGDQIIYVYPKLFTS